MSINTVTTGGFGISGGLTTTITDLVTRGYTLTAVAAPTIEGIEYTLSDNKLHYSMDENHLGYGLPTNKLHYSETD